MCKLKCYLGNLYGFLWLLKYFTILQNGQGSENNPQEGGRLSGEMSMVFGASKSQIKPRLNFRHIERFREAGHHFISDSHWQHSSFIALGELMQKHDQNAYRVSGSPWVFNKC